MNIKEEILKSIIIESINFTNGQSVIDAIKSNSVGSKVNPCFKSLNGNAESFVRRALDKYFSRCNTLKVKNITYGVQFLLSHTSDINIDNAVNNDALYSYLKNKQNTWAKQLPSFSKFENSQYNPTLWQDFENELNKESEKHGNRRLTAENTNNVKTLYKKDPWVVYMPLNYEGEIAVAKDNTGNAGWCTRRKEYYDEYTQNGKNHLYIIRNFSTGDAFQIAFCGKSVEIFDSVDGEEHAFSSRYLDDEYTQDNKKMISFLNKIPDEALTTIKDENEKKGRTLLDYKKNVKIKTQLEERKFGEPIKVTDYIYKKRILNYKDDSVSSYFEIKEEYASNKSGEQYAYMYYLIYDTSTYAIIHKGKIVAASRKADKNKEFMDTVEKDSGISKQIERFSIDKANKSNDETTFDISGCDKIENLKGSPEKVINFNCNHCIRLNSLEGAPKEVKNFYCCNNQKLISLKGAPEIVNGIFECAFCELKNLEGAPKKVGKLLRCYGNENITKQMAIEYLKHNDCPEIEGDFGTLKKSALKESCFNY